MNIVPTLRILDRIEQYDTLLDRFIYNRINTIRINFARHNVSEYMVHLDYIKNYFDKRNYKVQIMFDFPIPGEKYRLNIGQEAVYQIARGDIIVFTNEATENAKFTPLTWELKLSPK